VHPKFKPNPPASEIAMLVLNNSLPTQLPSAYLAALAIANGGAGFVGNRYIQLWAAEELLQWHKKYHVAEFAPNLFFIGSNGGGEAYAFSLAKADGEVYQIPFPANVAEYHQYHGRQCAGPESRFCDL
jgi:SMI1 / KNR4 family (SUKH-1)